MRKNIFLVFTLFTISMITARADNLAQDNGMLKAVAVDANKIHNSTDSLNPIDEDCINPEDQSINLSIDEISESIGPELLKERIISEQMRGCFAQMNKDLPTTFQDAIAFAIDSHLTHERSNEFGVLNYYQAGEFKKPISLINSPMCEEVDEYFVGGTSNIKNEVTRKFGDKQIAFEKAFNKLRNDYIQAVKENRSPSYLSAKLNDLKKLYYSLLASMAQHESLSTADSSSSRSNAGEAASFYGLKDYSKAPGVKFYFDKWQSDPHSKRNIGLYQFSASAAGNVSTCIKSWNQTFGDQYSRCKINIKGKNDNGELVRLLGASDQVFNAFCGASKLVQSMGVQVNSSVSRKGKRQRVHKNNISKDGSPKASENRCVSLFSHTLHTYNHFGTLGHTVLLDRNGNITKTSNVNNISSTNTSKLIDETLGAIGLE